MRWKRYGDPLIQKRRSPGSVTDEDRKRWAREEYQRNKDKYVARAKIWAEKNPDKKKEYLARDDVKAAARLRTKNWSAKNKDRKRVSDKAWVENNRSLANSYKAYRRAKERKATPSWLTAEHREAIAKIYAEALDLTQRLGTRHEVDHIVPLSGKTVSGLHVPWNLRAIPAQENNTRPRVWITQYDPPHPG
jgi:5-methylcytosine-specific restriction endonuclease McrA